MKGIVIGTSEYTKDFLKPCLKSLIGVKYPVLVVSNDGYNPKEIIGMLQEDFPNKISLLINSWNGWEIAVIQRGREMFSEFVHLMDTTLIKDISLFDRLFEIEGNVVLTKGNFHYMGKFVSNQLPNLPIVRDKTTAIMLEVKWLDGFPYKEFKPDLPVHSLKWEVVHGQNRMRLENKYMVKWKGTAWVSPEQLKELEEEINKKYDKNSRVR